MRRSMLVHSKGLKEYFQRIEAALDLGEEPDGTG